MQSLLNQLQSDEALLLMYAAGELPAEDRAQVEQRLEADPALRAELDRLRELNGSIDEALVELDTGTRLPVSEGVAVRKVGRVMRQWQTARMAPQVAEEPVDQLRFPWWSYPLATAAAVLLALLVWWGQQDGPPMQRANRPMPEPQYVQNNLPPGWDMNDVLERRLARSWSGYGQDALSIEPLASSDSGIDDVEGIFMSYPYPTESERTW